MNKKTLVAICLTLLVPIVVYFSLKIASAKATQMPNYYLLDSVVTRSENGKIAHDSIWHTVQNIKLVNQLGDTVNLYDIKDKVIVADFMFTGCGSVCPTLTRNMRRLQQSFEEGGQGITDGNLLGRNMVQFLSFSIDPLRDSVSRLKKYADKYGVNHDNWWFLTGPRDSIYNFIYEQLKVDKYNDTIPISPDFPHTARFVLIDKDHHIRGYYNGLDTVESIPKLAQDIALLMLSKDKNHPSPLPFDPVEYGVAFGIVIILVILLARILFKKKKQNES